MFGAIAAVIYVAGYQVQSGAMTTGGVTAFLFYMVMLVGNFGILAGVFGNIAKVLGASDKIVVLMMRQPPINTIGGRKLDDEGVAVKGDIKIENIKFNYPSKPDV
jgi:ATP-binding cassette subfamily B protein